MDNNEVVLLRRFQTPDGTILESRHQYDFVTHIDKNGEEYMLDGGSAYCRMSVNKEPMIDLSVTSSTPHEIKRETLTWGTRGVDGKSPLTFKPIKELSINHIESILNTQKLSPQLIAVFKDEVTYRLSQA